MPITSEMNERLEKMNELEEKGYQVKTSLGGFNHILINPEGQKINKFKDHYKNDTLPGFSPIGFWWGPYVAVQSRHWSFFWALGITSFITNIISLAINFEDFDLINTIGILIFYCIYAYNFPYQRWLFSKSNKKEITILPSIPIAIILIILAILPGIIIAESGDLEKLLKIMLEAI